MNRTLSFGNSGCQTFFYTNAQSARLQFYHDHAMGITRLNVYAGEAAGYVITDAVEQDMINGTNVSGVNPGAVSRSSPTSAFPWSSRTGPSWTPTRSSRRTPPGTGEQGKRRALGKSPQAVTGDLWYPHVYMTVQNPWDLTGTNAFGRWHYGPWFNPPIPECVNGRPVGCIEVGPVPNGTISLFVTTRIPTLRLGAADEAGGAEPLHTGRELPGHPASSTAPPTRTWRWSPRPYRFRVLNAANDRFLNLQLYVAADKNSWTPGTGPAVSLAPPTTLCGGTDPTDCTEVKMVPVSVAPANQYADTPSGIPDPATAGPDWIHDRHRRRLHAEAGRGAPAAHRL